MQEGQIIKGGPWDGFEVISTYSRAQALEDGALVDISEWAREYGIVYPVAVTRGVWSLIEDPEGMKCLGQSVRGRGLDVAAMLNLFIRRNREKSQFLFPVIFATGISQRKNEKRKTFWLKSVCGPGDKGEPVITVMLREED